ncbi:MAG: OmpA family protein [Coriobacteriia bacterium]|nr:OmpA family protein [Coriobacteriia bacterium]
MFGRIGIALRTMLVVALVASVLALPATASALPPAEQTIDNGILRLAVTPSGGPKVYVDQDGPAGPMGWVHQYYGGAGWGSVLWLGTTASYTSGYRTGTAPGGVFTAVSNDIVTIAGGKQIVTVFDAGTSGIRITQTLTLMDGDRFFTKSWAIANSGPTTHTDVRLYHGGDTYFGGEDSASSFYDPAKSMVYVRNNNYANWGLMGFYANPATPANHYFGGHYSIGNGYATAGTDLPDSANTAYTDAGYYLQWNRATLSPGETWLIEAYELWTPGGPLQMLAPGPQNAAPDSTVALPFTLQNLSTSPQDVTVSASDSSGGTWDVDVVGATTLTLPAGSATTIYVDVNVPDIASGYSDITLSATGPGGSSSATTRLTALDVGVDISPTTLSYSGRPGDTSSQTIRVTNNGSQPLSFGAPSAGAPFGVAAGSAGAFTLAVGEYRDLTIDFSPSADGDFTGSLSVPLISPVLVTLSAPLSGEAVSDVTASYLAGLNGSIEGSATQVVAVGADCTSVTAKADSGWKFKQWDDGVLTAERRDTNVTADMDVTAEFEISNVTLSYLAAPNGTVAGSTTQVIQTGNSGSAVTAVPAPGYWFTGWSDGVSTATRSDLAGDSDLTVTASFAYIPVARTDEIGTYQTTVWIDVLGNDDVGVGNVLSQSQAGNGTVTRGMTGQPNLIGYTPNAGFTGEDGFMYMTDSGAIAWVRVSVRHALSAPRDLAASQASATTALVSWNAPAHTGPGLGGYQVAWRVAGVGDWVYGPRLSTSATSHSVEGLATGVAYEFRAISLGSDGVDAGSSPVSLTLGGAGDPGDGGSGGGGDPIDVIVPPVTTAGPTSTSIPVSGLEDGDETSVTVTTPGAGSARLEGAALVVSPRPGFSGTMLVEVTVTRGADSVTKTVSVTVNPGPPHAITYTPAGAASSLIKWTGSTNAKGYRVYVNGRLVGTTSAAVSQLRINTLLGPNAVVQVQAYGNNGTESVRVRGTYRAAHDVRIGTIRFQGDSATLTASGKRELRKLAALVKAQGFKTVVVDGFTAGAAPGGAAFRARLSAQRAQNVRTYLLAEFRRLGVKVNVVASGRGNSSPIGSNLSEAGRVLNRRAEISIR